MCTQGLLNRLEAELNHIQTQITNPQFINAGPQIDWVNPLDPYTEYPVVGNRLQNFADRWEILFPNSIAHKWLREGVPLKFLNKPPKLQREPKHFPLPPAQELEREQAALDLLQKGVVEVVKDSTSPGMYHRLFMRPKPDGTMRPIIDLSPLNKLIENETFKMETPASIRQALQPGEHTLQLDLKDAYFHVPIKKAYRKYMRFTANGVIYQYKALPFGLSIAPRVFTKILKPILGMLRKAMIRVHAYLDDWILRLHSLLIAPQTAITVTQLLRSLGWLINFPKSCLHPRDLFEFIGLEWNLRGNAIKPRLEKIHQLRSDVKVAQPGKRIKAKKMASLVGVIKWMAPYVPLGNMHLKKLQWKIRQKWSQSVHGWNAKILVTRSMYDLLRWWTRPTNTHRGVPLKPPHPTLDIFTDASCHGYGAIMGTATMSGEWTRRYREKHINHLELEATRRALLTFAEDVENKVVRLHTDNRTTVSCLRRQGSLKSRSLNKLTAKIVTWAAKHKVTLVVVHIQGYRNVEADALSRKDLTHASEWSLSKQEFNRVVNWSQLLPPWIDLMATSRNRQTDTFISPYPHEEAAAVDALNVTWNYPGTVWLYPPTAVMTKVINKIRESDSLTMILITPHAPQKPWYADLLTMATNRSLNVGRKQGSIIQHVPLKEEPVVMENPEILNLRAWIIQK